MKLSKAQQKVVDHLESGGRLVVTFAGIFPGPPGGRARLGRGLHPATEAAVLGHLSGRLVRAFVLSPKFNIPETFICLHQHFDSNLADRQLLKMAQL